MSLTVTIDVYGKVFDTLTREAKLMLNGFDDQMSISNVLGMSKTGNLASSVVETIMFPDTMVGEPTLRAVLYSTTLDSILDAVKSLIQKPYGCFEQTSSVTYPMVMALQLLQEMKKQFTQRGDTETVEKIEEMEKEIIANLKDGYQKLIGFETTT